VVGRIVTVAEVVVVRTVDEGDESLVVAGKVDEGDESVVVAVVTAIVDEVDKIVLVGVVSGKGDKGTDVVVGWVESFNRDANPAAIPPPMAAARTITRTTIKIQNILGLRPATVRRRATS